MDDGIFYSIIDGICFIKLTGSIQHKYSKRLGCLSRAIANDDESYRYIIDLSKTTHLDSTALGIIAGICVKNPSTESHVIFSTNPDVDTIMRTVGFFELFNISADIDIHLDTLKSIPYSCCGLESLPDIILEAHQVLSSLNEENRKLFAGVIQCFSPQDFS